MLFAEPAPGTLEACRQCGGVLCLRPDRIACTMCGLSLTEPAKATAPAPVQQQAAKPATTQTTTTPAETAPPATTQQTSTQQGSQQGNQQQHRRK